MRRNARNSQNDDMGNQIIKYASIGVVILTVIVIGLLIYSQSLTDDVRESTLNREQLANLMNRSNENEVQEEGTEATSTEMGKTVEEAKNELENSNTTNQTSDRTSQSNTTNTTNSTSTTNTSKSSNTTKTTTNSSNTNKPVTTNTNQTNATKTENAVTTNQTTEPKTEKKETTQELAFVKPVEGEIVKEYAKENLLFSETLQEWTVHTGIDIQADKTTVVKAAEAGTIKSIKNDPRYGLTIVVEHANGFQTVYSNLLTSEFVVEGEKVEKEQSLGTVGNTAAFESADEPHLHFEVLKDNAQVDPTIYLK